jgi:hypothetical protein
VSTTKHNTDDTDHFKLNVITWIIIKLQKILNISW